MRATLALETWRDSSMRPTKTPAEYTMPSTQKLQKKEAATMTQPHPPSGGTVTYVTTVCSSSRGLFLLPRSPVPFFDSPFEFICNKQQHKVKVELSMIILRFTKYSASSFSPTYFEVGVAWLVYISGYPNARSIKTRIHQSFCC